jgi:nicotinamidase-related amidase/type 1 glutamine amidotransferase
MRSPLALPLLLASLMVAPSELSGGALEFSLRDRVETSAGSGRYHVRTRSESWDPSRTALIVCDMWDLHHCLSAVRREAEFAPRLEQVLTQARERGVTIIHAPSGCMDFYRNHPARLRAIATPPARHLPPDIQAWCRQIPAEEHQVYPLDQTGSTEDDDPAEHARWAAELSAKGLNPRAPWTRQIDILTIDPDRDYISDLGDQVWSILEARGIDHVILTGVHTNMCVLGRPFGLRQLARNGKRVVLMRDLTDTMYDPNTWPFVSHFTGTDLIVAHIEKFVCPTITSDQLLGGSPFRFRSDTRPDVVLLIGEDEYQTEHTIPKFALEHLGRDFRVSCVFADDADKHQFPGIEQVDAADVLVVSVRRRTPPAAQLEFVRRHVASGKPVVGIRTASHAFSLRGQSPPDGHVSWPEFDAQVFGGNYTNHHGNSLACLVSLVDSPSEHTLLAGLPGEGFPAGGSLYKVSPLAEGCVPILMGHVEGAPGEPVAWTFTRPDGGRSFYTSLGHSKDFETPAFVRLLQNAIRWAAAEAAPGDSGTVR